MHIKQLTIYNFRSFEKQPEIHPFSPGCNSVVGRNGSGKSNLFDAVQFVLLSPRFYSLRQEERQALLHEGAGSAAVNAFVEVVFDNSDNRFSMENSDEVVLRRTIGPKKDEFFLQRKRATKTEVSSLLEGAGFSKSNPYFMIQQGKIQDICTMRDNERLALLKSVAGTTVYDEKKQESLTKMEENKNSCDKIAALLADIESRLEELHGEKEELTNYQQLDRKRRAIEYTLYDKELRRARKYLDDLEHDRFEHTDRLSELHKEKKRLEEEIVNVDARLKTKQNTLKRSKTSFKSLEADKTAAVKQVTKLKLQVQELQENINGKESQDQANQKELKVLQKAITKAQNQLKQIKPQHEEASTKLQQMNHELDQTKKQAKGLHAKQGRGSHFQTKAERDAYLQGNIQDLVDSKAEKQAALTDQQQSLANLRRSIKEETLALQQSSEQIDSNKEQQQAFVKTIDAKKKQRVEVQERRQNQWQATGQKEQEYKEARENRGKANAEARKVMPRATAFGLESLERVVREENMIVGEQYFGMLMDNFELTEEKYRTAVEVAAQNSLFHVIVDNDQTAAKLMKRLEDGKLGRVTFLPLNRLHVPAVPSGVGRSKDVKPMLELCLEYRDHVSPAIEHVFNQKLLARSLDAAAECSKTLGMDAITMDGNLAGRKGALTGGFVDTSKSRLKAHYNKKDAEEKLRIAEQQFHKARQDAQVVDQEAANVSQELQRLETKNKDMQRQIKDMEREHDRKKRRIEKNSKQEGKLKEKIPPLELEISGYAADVKRLQDEMKTELTSTLSSEEKQLLVTLKGKEKKLSSDIEQQTDAVYRAGEQRQRLESLLEDNLMKRKQELEGLMPMQEEEDESGFAASSTFKDQILLLEGELEDKNNELDAATRIMQGVESQMEEARQAAEEVKAQKQSAAAELEELKNEDAKNSKEIKEAESRSEKMLMKRHTATEKRESYSSKIQQLGALPPPAEREPYNNKSIQDLMKTLESVNKKLKKYSHVNKKAFDQYVNFSEQRDSLLKRKADLDRGAESVVELIESLDRQKDEAINRTFRGVSAHFKDVFKELVPLGEGELVMRTAIDEGDSDGEDGEKKPKAIDPKNPDVSLYRGVSVKVRFSRVGENFLMSQLSGGQKALVALALIFAIQRCDPAPFYIFDELDQALDSSYRASVAQLIQRQAHSEDNPTQFIVSTFRPELVRVADQCYGISHQSKVSRFHHMDQNDALDFIANLMTEEEGVGEVTTTRKRKNSTRKRKAEEAATTEG